MSYRSVSLAIVLCLLWLVAPARAQGVEVRFLDVGQADATLIRSGGCTALIDAGIGDAAARRLAELGIERVDYLIASHNHRDHIGGVGEVTRVAQVGLYIHNGRPERSQTQRFTLAMLDRQGAPRRVASLDTLPCGEARLIVAASPLAGITNEQNDQSVIVRLELGEFSALFTGDSGVEQLNAMIATGWARPVTVLKVAHHGARDGVTPLWISRVRPDLVVISAGTGNAYGHPDLAALRYYLAGGRDVLRTDRDGEVVVQGEASGTFAME
jgi:beta-lactamase superfamily II metal-dependent hydrolase